MRRASQAAWLSALGADVPGEAASVVTCLDGYQMARQGWGGAALGR